MENTKAGYEMVADGQARYSIIVVKVFANGEYSMVENRR